MEISALVPFVTRGTVLLPLVHFALLLSRPISIKSTLIEKKLYKLN